MYQRRFIKFDKLIEDFSDTNKRISYLVDVTNKLITILVAKNVIDHGSNMFYKIYDIPKELSDK